MKKYLMIGFAAVAFAACSNHDFETYSQEQIIQNEYKANFVAEFGQPASNHTWGFGATTRAAAPAFTRAETHNVTFPDGPAATDYKTTYPEGTENLGTYKEGGVWFVDESNSGARVELNPNRDGVGGSILYLVHQEGRNGIIAPSYFYVDARNTEGAIVYICPGVTLKLNTNDSGNLYSGLKMYIAQGATLEAEGELKLNSVTIYNNGRIKAPKLSVNGTGTLYNQNNVVIDGDISVENANSFIVNEGNLTADNYGSRGSGSFWNSGGTVLINNITDVNSNSNGWVNEGEYTTKYFNYTAGSINVWNNCKLTVEEDFNINLGDNATSGFYMDGGSSVVTKNFNGGGNFTAYYPAWWKDVEYKGGPFRIVMGVNSLFKVTGTATMNATKADYGIYGPTTGHAVFQAHVIVAGAENQGAEVTYGNNLYVYSETTHFAQGYTDATSAAAQANNGIGSDAYIRFAGGCSEDNIYASNFKSGKPASIPANGKCNDGFSGDTPSTITYQGRIMVEDLSAQADVTGKNSDWDFNDVVFDWAIDGGKAYIRLLAAGGTLPIRIGGTRNDTSSEPVGSVEIHTDAERGLGGYMKNCGVGDKVPYKEFVLEDHTYDTAKNILITVYKGGSWVEVLADQGEPAAKFNCKVGTNWCDEYVNITRVYPSFKQWVENPTVDWTNLAEDKARLVDGILSNNAPAE